MPMTLDNLMKMGYNIFDEYPIFDEVYRPVLEKKITDYYRFYRIGSETPDRFKHYLNEQLRRVMPYYNKLYETEMIKFDPLATYFHDEHRANKQYGTYNGSEHQEDSGTLTELVNRQETDKESQSANNKELYRDNEDLNTKTVFTEDVIESKRDEGEGTKNLTVDRTTTTDDTTTIESTSETTGNQSTHELLDGHHTVDFTENKNDKYSDTPQARFDPDDVNATFLTNIRDVDTTSNTVTDDTVSTDGTKETTENVSSDQTTQYDGSKKDTGTEKEASTSILQSDTQKNTDSEQDITGGKIAYGDKTLDATSNGTVESTLSEGSSKEQASTASKLSSGGNTTDGFIDIKASGRSNFIPANLLKAFRESLLNIDEEIVLALMPNFYGVF